MNINVKVIRFTSFCSVVFALLTYLVSINISHRYLVSASSPCREKTVWA